MGTTTMFGWIAIGLVVLFVVFNVIVVIVSWKRKRKITKLTTSLSEAIIAKNKAEEAKEPKYDIVLERSEHGFWRWYLLDRTPIPHKFGWATGKYKERARAEETYAPLLLPGVEVKVIDKYQNRVQGPDIPSKDNKEPS